VGELEFLGAVHVEWLRHGELRTGRGEHGLFQTSTVQALLGGAFDGDVTLGEVIEHGDLGLGTLNGLDGELIVVDGQAWKADLDCSLARPAASSGTPYAVVVRFSPGPPIRLGGPFQDSDLGQRLGRPLDQANRPVAIRLDGRFQAVRVRSIPRQRRPYPPLAEAVAHQHVSDLGEVSGTMVGFCFPDALDGIEMVGWHLHFVNHERTRGGHVLSYTLLDAVAQVDDVTELHIELPPAIDVHTGAEVDQDALRRLETDG
jgi:acetolactate decarboxylase